VIKPIISYLEFDRGWIIVTQNVKRVCAAYIVVCSVFRHPLTVTDDHQERLYLFSCLLQICGLSGLIGMLVDIIGCNQLKKSGQLCTGYK
jgi:hypothetical protein